MACWDLGSGGVITIDFGEPISGGILDSDVVDRYGNFLAWFRQAIDDLIWWDTMESEYFTRRNARPELTSTGD